MKDKKRDSIDFSSATKEERTAWDLYFTAVIPTFMTSLGGAEVAAIQADVMLKERQKRFQGRED